MFTTASFRHLQKEPRCSVILVSWSTEGAVSLLENSAEWKSKSKWWYERRVFCLLTDCISDGLKLILLLKPQLMLWVWRTLTLLLTVNPPIDQFHRLLLNSDSCLIMSGEAYNVNKNVKLGIFFLVCPTSQGGKNNFLDASEMKRVSTTLKWVNSRCWLNWFSFYFYKKLWMTNILQWKDKCFENVILSSLNFHLKSV